MTMITNLQHFLNENGQTASLTPEAEELLHFLGKVVEAATLDEDYPVTFADAQCRNSQHVCQRDIEVWMDPDTHNIGWECLECGDEGIITGWEGTWWDKRTYTKH